MSYFILTVGLCLVALLVVMIMDLSNPEPDTYPELDTAPEPIPSPDPEGPRVSDFSADTQVIIEYGPKPSVHIPQEHNPVVPEEVPVPVTPQNPEYPEAIKELSTFHALAGNSMEVDTMGGGEYYHVTIRSSLSNGADQYRHSEYDPSVMVFSSTGEITMRVWYLNDVIDRENAPAVITTNAVMWCRGGVAHREDGPAIVKNDGGFGWFRNGEDYRDHTSGPTKVVVSNDGTMVMMCWCQDGKFHRDGGPAIIMSDGTNQWYRHGNLYNPNL